MATDDFVRVVYSRTVDGRRKRSAISVDPDLYFIFCLIRGSSPAARAQMRAWAISVDSNQEKLCTGIGVSRLVHRKVLAEIKTLVQQGLRVKHVETQPPKATE